MERKEYIKRMVQWVIEDNVWADIAYDEGDGDYDTYEKYEEAFPHLLGAYIMKYRTIERARKKMREFYEEKKPTRTG